MFTGIVRERGRVESVDRRDGGLRITVTAPETAARAQIGDSVSINGCCLTAVGIDGERISFDAVPETLRRTSLNDVTRGSNVNIEPAVRAGEPLGGHYVQGHVDAVGRVAAVDREGAGLRVWIDAPDDVLRYCVEKGSIAVDGVSLTIVERRDGAFAVALVPHTLEVTTLGDAVPGRAVNLEVDVLAKYVERLLPAP